MVNSRQVVRAIVLGLLLSTFTLMSVSAAFGQDFVLTAQPFSPPAVDPGVSASTTISVQPMNTTSTPTVNLTCTVAPVLTNGPTCASPGSFVAPATAGLTVDTPGAPEITYTITVTGTDATGTQSVSLSLTVVAVTPDYTLTVTTPLNPSSLHAGAGTSGVVTLTPLNGYTSPPGGVTLSCSMVTPPVIPGPQCSFSSTPGGPPTPVSVTSSAPVTSIITITTAGPVTTTQLRPSRIFYALWFLVPGLALAGVGSAGGRSRKWLGWLLLMTLVAGILLIPACSGTTPTTSPTGTGTTPKNTYTFTLSGVDANGLGQSNTSPTITLTVD